MTFANDARQRRILCVTSRSEVARDVLAHVSAWQRALACRVRVLLVLDASRTSSPALERFQRWASRETNVSVDLDDLSTCTSSEFFANLDTVQLDRGDLVVTSGQRDVASELDAVPLRGLWSSALRRGACLLIVRDSSPPRRTLVVTDGTARTLPVTSTALELAERFDLQPSYFDSMRVPLNRLALEARRAGPNLAACAYLRALAGLSVALNRARRESRADLLVAGASSSDEAAADLLLSAHLPCSVLVVPCGT
jgi:hypothetical protein